MKKGFTLIELLAVIVILAVIALIATPIILGLISDSKKQAFKNSTYGISQAAKNNYVETMYKGETPVDVVFTYTNGVESSSVAGKSLKYEGEKPQNGTISLTSNGSVALALHSGTLCAYKSFSDSEVTVEEKALADCTYEYSVTEGANVPKLTTGMTPIKWDGSNWIETSINDSDWYSYDTANKKWANAKTADGSMWVWVPRYVYKISSNWHSNTAGSIDIQFSKGTKDDWNSNITLNTGTGASASNNTWTNHPAFTFGSTELTGIWVAKFEPTAAEGVANGYVADFSCPTVGDNVTTKNVKIIPNVVSWRCITIGNAFTNTRNMETNTLYGWGVSGNGIDTHLMKNTEWGVIAYLSKSNYGQGTNEIYINNSQTYTTGCAGNTVSASGYNGCQNTYKSTEGVKASTTGNIYGIYDMSGGAWEFVAAYVNNANGSLNQGSNIISAAAQYKNVYTKASTDAQADNYALMVNSKGDAVYEISNNIGGSYAWFNDYSFIPYFDNPWFRRGGSTENTSSAGAYGLSYAWGGVYSNYGFRPILAVASGL